MSAALRVLGLAEGATVVEVRRAYKELARHLHPDAGGDAAQFDALNQAYRTALDEVNETGCPACNGTGRVTHYYGHLSASFPCPRCRCEG